MEEKDEEEEDEHEGEDVEIRTPAGVLIFWYDYTHWYDCKQAFRILAQRLAALELGSIRHII